MSEQVFTNCTTEGPIHVYVRDGKVVRIRPFVADEKDFRPWAIEAGGKILYAPDEIPSRPFHPRGEDTALFGRPDQVPHEEKGLRSEG